MNVTDLLKMLDFEEFDYFYHETGDGVGEEIMEEGLLVEGTNILDTNNIAYTTISPLTPDLVKTPQDFVKFLSYEKSSSPTREVAEMVIIGAGKEVLGNLVEPYDEMHDGQHYDGIIRSHHVMGVIDLDTLEFNFNENFEYAAEANEKMDFML